MANNNKQQSEINLLKASFCRQHFPDLMQFLRKFDISSTFNEKEEEENFKDDLSMHFLIQAYDNRNETIPQRNTKQNETEEAYNKRVEESHAEYLKINRELKSNCKWCFPNIIETDVILAINEYFEIISTREDLIELTKVLIKNINDKDNIKENLKQILTHQEDDNNQYQIEDNTTLTLLQYFGIKTPNTNLGKQRDDFARFILHSTGLATLGNDYNPSKKTFPEKHCEYNPQVRFIQAFELLACVRNWYGHEFVFSKLSPDSIVTLCRFIIFTHIGVTYICRNLWNDENIASKLTERGNIRPKNFLLEDITFEVNIKGINRTDIISECDLEGASSDDICNTPSNSVTFHVAAKMYQLFKIKFKCNNDSYKVLGKLNYYSWEPILNIVVKPPKDVSYIFKGLANDNDLEEYLGKLFGKYMEIYTDPKATNEQKEQNEEILKKIGDLETQFLKLQGIIEHENEKAITEMKETIRQKLFNISENQDEILKKLDEIQDTITGTRDIVTNTGEKIDEEIRKREEERKKREEERKKREKNRKKLFKNLIVTFFFLLACIVSFCSFSDNISTNLLWLKCRIWYFIAALIITGVVSWLLWKLRKGIGEKPKWDYGIVGVAALMLFGSPFLFRYQSNKSLVEEYDFLGQDSICNRKVALYLEEQIPGDEEAIRSKLALYYTDIVGDLGKASQISSPLLNVDKYKEGSLAAMYVLYRQGEISSFQDYVELYGERYGEEDPAYCDLKGVMLLDTLYDERDVHKGMDYLLKAYEAGSMTACYNLGYLLSTDQSTMENEKLGKRAQNSHYDIPKAVRYLREASAFLPEASIQLADIYSDLQMKDSALFYYQKAIDDANNGMIRINGLYKLGIFLNKNGIKNDAVLSAQTMKYPPAFIFPAVAMDEDKNLINKSHSVYDYFLMLFKNKAHKKAIKRFEEIQRKESSLTLDEMGLYQYIPPVVFDYVYIGEREKALATLQKYRKEAHFDMTFIYSVEKLLGTATVPKDSIKAMQLMHESAAKGCVYSEMYCIFKDMVRDFANISLLKNAASRLHEISNIIPFAHVLESILLMESGNIEEGERAIHMAMWKKHPAGAFAFEFLPNKYHIDKLNKSKNADDSTLFVSRKLMEMSLRSTWSYKDNILVNVCYLDWLQHKRDKKNYKENFIFWSEVAIVSGSLSSQLKLLSIYEEMIKNGDVDKNERIIDNLIRSVLSNVMNGKFDNNTNTKCNNYLAWFLKNDSLVSPTYAQELFRFYGTTELLQSYEKAERNKRAKLPIVISLMDLHTIDDYSILSEFSYFAGPYSFEIAGNGGGITLFYRPDNR